jgi:hypothetical protein
MAKNGVFWLKTKQNIVGFYEKRQFFRRKSAKIAKNCDHNTNPRFCAYWVIVYFGKHF